MSDHTTTKVEGIVADTATIVIAAVQRQDPRFQQALLYLAEDEQARAVTVDSLTQATLPGHEQCLHYAALAGLRLLQQHQALDGQHHLSTTLRHALRQALSQAVQQRLGEEREKHNGLENPSSSSHDSKRTSSVHCLPASERPRERLLRLGSAALSAEELVAILLGTGSHEQDVLELARQLIIDYDGLLGLAQLDNEELQLIHGLGPAKIASLSAALEIGRRLGQQASSRATTAD